MAKLVRKPKQPPVRKIMLRSLGGPPVGIILTNPDGESVYIEPVWEDDDWTFRCSWGVDVLNIDAGTPVMMMLVSAD